MGNGYQSQPGKATLDKPFDRFIPEQLAQNGIDVLTIDFSHVAIVANLPFHHRDPFDRLIVAQAILEEISVVSSDEEFDSYGVTRCW